MSTALKSRPAVAGTLEQKLVEVLRGMKGLKPVEVVEHLRTAVNKAMPARSKSPLVDALLRGIEAQRQIKESEGGTLSLEEAARVLALNSKQAVIDRFNKNRLIGWREKQGAIRLPVWQFDGAGGVLKGVPEVLAILAQGHSMDDWGKVLFFVNPRESLKGQRPLDLLRKGKTQPVIDLAKAYIE